MKTKDGKQIDFLISHIEETEDGKKHLFNSVSFNAFIDGELVGNAKLTYIPKEKIFSDAVGYLIYKNYCSNEKLINAYQSSDYKTILKLIGTKTPGIALINLDNKNQSDIFQLYKHFLDTIENDYGNQARSFIEYWVDKPSIEIIRVFTEKDTTVTNYTNGNAEKIKRINTNWQNLGVGQAIYTTIINWCEEHDFSLWSSKTRTEEAKKIWYKLDSNPKFTVIAESSLFGRPNKDFKTRLKVKKNN